MLSGAHHSSATDYLERTVWAKFREDTTVSQTHSESAAGTLQAPEEMELMTSPSASQEARSVSSSPQVPSRLMCLRSRCHKKSGEGRRKIG
jgi:hypothetical protein